jgi:hypothetical protein
MIGNTSQTLKLRKQTFEDMHKEVPIHELPIVFTGTVDQCNKYATDNGFVWKPSPKMLFRGWFYKAPVPNGPGVSLHPTL